MEEPGLGILDEKMKMMKWNRSGSEGRWATVLEMPVDTGGQFRLVEKDLSEWPVNWYLHGKPLDFQGCWRKVEKADGTVQWGIFVGMKVGFARTGIVAVRQLFMVVVAEPKVGLLQHHDLKDQHRQQEGGDLAICRLVFQKNGKTKNLFTQKPEPLKSLGRLMIIGKNAIAV